MSVLSVCMYMDQMHAWCPERPKEGIQSHGTEIRDVMNCHVSPGKRTQVH